MTLHILWKDVRRLWPGIAASLVLLGSLAWQDRSRGGWGPGPVEGYLNLLVPIVWASLLALAVTQDPIPGERQFWITRPFRPAAMLASKLLFAALFVHLPSLAADCYILGAHGLSPLAHAPQLLLRQFAVACAITIPALALATLVRSFTHFILAAVGIAAAFLVAASGYPLLQLPLVHGVRRLLAIAIAAAAGAVILAAQYFGRRVVFSRVLGTAAAVAASLTFALLLPPEALAVRTTLAPAAVRPRIEIDGAPRLTYSPGRGNRPLLAITVRIAGLPADVGAHATVIRSELIAADGARYGETLRTRYNPSTPPSHYFSFYQDRLNLSIDPRVYESLARGPATVRGEAAIDAYRLDRPVYLRLGERAEVQGVGLCGVRRYDDPFRPPRVEVECESPSAIEGADVRIFNARGWSGWRGSLFPVHTPVAPAIDWLSPLQRRLAYQNIGNDHTFDIPPDAIPGLMVEITPHIPLGTAAAHYEFRDIDVRKLPTTLGDAGQTTPAQIREALRRIAAPAAKR